MKEEKNTKLFGPSDPSSECPQKSRFEKTGFDMVGISICPRIWE
jgi:hypothetical protein